MYRTFVIYLIWCLHHCILWKKILHINCKVLFYFWLKSDEGCKLSVTRYCQPQSCTWHLLEFFLFWGGNCMWIFTSWIILGMSLLLLWYTIWILESTTWCCLKMMMKKYASECGFWISSRWLGAYYRQLFRPFVHHNGMLSLGLQWKVYF